MFKFKLVIYFLVKDDKTLPSFTSLLLYLVAFTVCFPFFFFFVKEGSAALCIAAQEAVQTNENSLTVY